MSTEREIAHEILRQLQMSAKIKSGRRYADLADIKKQFKRSMMRKLYNNSISRDDYETLSEWSNEDENEINKANFIYENPFMYNVAQSIFENIEAFCKSNPEIYTTRNIKEEDDDENDDDDERVKEEVTFKDIPVWGTLDMEEFSAFVCTEDNAENIILISSGMFLFAHLLSKVISQAFPIIYKNGEAVGISTDYKKAIKRIKKNKIISVRFIDLMLSYLLTDSAQEAKQYLIPEKYYNTIAGIFTEAFETFVLAHEYSHHNLGHLENKAENNKITLEDIHLKHVDNFIDEVNADSLGAVITIGVMGERHGIDRALPLVGILLAMNTLKIFERLKESDFNIDFNIKDSTMPSSPELPSSNFRKRFLFHSEGVIGSLNNLELLEHVDKVFNELFQEFRKFITKTKKKHFGNENVDFYTLQTLLYEIYENEKTDSQNNILQRIIKKMKSFCKKT